MIFSARSLATSVVATLSVVSFLVAPIPALGEEASTVELNGELLVQRYLAARGGAQRWREVKTLEMTGTYAAFSIESRFSLIRRQGDLFRLEYTLGKVPAIRARDAEGPWMQHKFLAPDPQRVTEGAYKNQLERESLFGLELLNWRQKGLKIQYLVSRAESSLPFEGRFIPLCRVAAPRNTPSITASPRLAQRATRPSR